MTLTKEYLAEQLAWWQESLAALQAAGMDHQTAAVHVELYRLALAALEIQEMLEDQRQGTMPWSTGKMLRKLRGQP